MCLHVSRATWMRSRVMASGVCNTWGGDGRAPGGLRGGVVALPWLVARGRGVSSATSGVVRGGLAAGAGGWGGFSGRDCAGGDMGHVGAAPGERFRWKGLQWQNMGDK